MKRRRSEFEGHVGTGRGRGLLVLGMSAGLLWGCGDSDSIPGQQVGTQGSGVGTGTQPGLVSCTPRVHGGDVVANEPSAVKALKGVTHIAGSLVLDAGALGEVAALDCLEQVDGELTLRGNEFRRFDAKPLAALQRLVRVGGALTVDSVLGMQTLGLSGLQNVGGDLRVINNPDLVDLSGLEKLADVQGQLMVARNQLLNNLDGLVSVRQAAEVLILENPSLMRVGGFVPLERTGRLKFARNPLLQSLAGLENIQQVEALVVESNDALVDLAALAKLRGVDLELLILTNANLTSVRGLGALAQVPPRFDIQNNPRLADLDGLSGLAAPAQANAKLTIKHNPVLTRLGPWQHWVQGSGELHLEGNAALSTLAGLENLTSIGALTLHGPDQIADLNGLGKLARVERRLSIGARDTWSSVVGLGALTQVGELEVVGMTQLQDLSRFATVGSISGLRLFSLPKLNDLRAFAHLTALSGDLWLDDMAGLPNLAGLEAMTRVQGRLVMSRVNQIKSFKELSSLREMGTIVVANNAQLASFDGLSGVTLLTQEEGGLCIHQNPALAQFDALASLQKVEGSVTLTENPALLTVQGMAGLAEIGSSLWIDGSPKVSTLAPFAKLTKIGGRAWSFDDTCPSILAPREENTQLQPYHGYMGIEVRMMNIPNLKGFENLKMIKGGISIKENPMMTDLSELFGARVEGVTVEVRRNPKMPQCHALSIMDNLGFFDGGDIRIWDNLGVDEPDCG